MKLDFGESDFTVCILLMMTKSCTFGNDLKIRDNMAYFAMRNDSL